MMNILVVVSGGIAAYKICDVIGLLRRQGHKVAVVMTRNATQFITPLTLATLTGRPVHIEPFGDRSDVEHIELAKWSDRVLLAPATYNIIGKYAGGIADDLATSIIAALPQGKPVFIAPAMNTEMWKKPMLKRNLRTLESDVGAVVIPPRKARLACGDEGEGALARPADIVAAVTA